VSATRLEINLKAKPRPTTAPVYQPGPAGTITLELGKTYVTKCGGIVGPMHNNGDYCQHYGWFKGPYNKAVNGEPVHKEKYFDKQGRYISQEHNVAYDHHIVKEYVEPIPAGECSNADAQKAWANGQKVWFLTKSNVWKHFPMLNETPLGPHIYAEYGWKWKVSA
jgi:hypothetical protein